MIDWASSNSTVLINPRMPEEAKKILLGAVVQKDRFPEHIWIATSGTSGLLKWVLLSKKAILISAEAVNTHLQSTSTDVWLNPLPEFHVGGLGIVARGLVSGASVVPCTFPDGRWNPHSFLEQLHKNKITLTSLVPAQIFDLVKDGLTPPSHLRAVVVGGGALSEEIYSQAIVLGWKLLPSYGLTECASQVATAPIGSSTYPSLVPLSHVSLSYDNEGRIKIKSEALLTAYIECNQDESYRCWDPKEAGWFTTEDYAIIDKESNTLKGVTRGVNFVKIGGESVDLQRLEKILAETALSCQCPFDVAISALPDSRLGHTIHLAATTSNNGLIASLIEKFNCRVLPFEQIRHTHFVSTIPRTPLNKIIRKDLEAILTKAESRKQRQKAEIA